MFGILCESMMSGKSICPILMCFYVTTTFVAQLEIEFTVLILNSTYVCVLIEACNLQAKRVQGR